MRGIVRSLLIPAVVVFVLSVCALAQREQPPSPSPNILLITIDTLRADHLSCYGYRRLTSPNIDRLASTGVRFENAYTVIPLTGPAHISIMTGLFPQQHGATINGTHIGSRMQNQRPPVLLAQVLKRLRNYKTGAFVSAWPLKKGITGLGHGFDTYNQKFEYHYNLLSAARTASEVGPLSRQWIQKHAADAHPFFLWVHYFDPHAPYELHQEFANLPPNPAAVPEQVAIHKEKRDVAEKIRAYDSEIAYTDHDIGQTLRLLDETGIRKKTLILLLADHGEAMGENGYFGHGNHADQGILHIPMIISYPGLIPRDRNISQDISQVDIMPTVLDYAGINVGLPISGRNLRPLIETSRQAPQFGTIFFVTYAEPVTHLPRWITWMWSWARSKRTPSRIGFIRGNTKVVRLGKNRLEIFKLSNQFKTEQLVSDHSSMSGKREDYEQYLTAWFRRTDTGLPADQRLTDRDAEMLRSLGYQP